MAPEIRKIKLSCGWVQYELTQKNIKNLNMHFTRNGTLKVSAPVGVKIERIEAFICQNEKFISLAKERLAAKIVLDDRWLERQFIYYLGERVPLMVKKAEGNQFMRKEGLLVFGTKEREAEKQRQILQRWLDGEAKRVIMEVFEQIYPQFSQYIPQKPQVKLRKMTARWGSCSKGKGIIILNKRLLHLPIECIECVITHELVHFLVPNHSGDFYHNLAQFRPNYRDEEKILQEYICQ